MGKMGKLSDWYVAYVLLRLVLGLNIAMHGLGRLIAGPAKFTDTITHQFASTPLPAWSIHLFSACLPWTEAAIGLAILFGVFTRAALIAGLLEIVVLTFGTTLLQDWEAAAIQLFYALIYAILLASCEYNAISLDGWLHRRSMDARKHLP